MIQRRIEKLGAASVRLAALLDRPARRQVGVKIDFTGFVIPDRFVIGYGLDYAERYRNLPFIGTLAPHVYKDDEPSDAGHAADGAAAAPGDAGEGNRISDQER